MSKYIRESYPSKDFNVEGQKFIIVDQKPQEFISKLIQILTDMKVEIISAEVVEPNLENVFLYLTGKKLLETKSNRGEYIVFWVVLKDLLLFFRDKEKLFYTFFYAYHINCYI